MEIPNDAIAGQFLYEQIKRLGFIEYKDGLKVNQSLLTVVLQIEETDETHRSG